MFGVGDERSNERRCVGTSQGFTGVDVVVNSSWNVVLRNARVWKGTVSFVMC